MIEKDNEKSNTDQLCFECKYGCKLTFQRKSCLINHEKSHIINTRYEAEFQCQIKECMKGFCSKDHLEAHQLIHNSQSTQTLIHTQHSSSTINSIISTHYEKQELINSMNEELPLKLNQFSKISTCEMEGCTKKIPLKRKLYNDETFER